MINPAWGQAAPHPGAPPALMQFAPLILIFGVFYFLLIRPQQQKAKEHRVMLANLKKNDEVITAGGIFGKVVALNEKVVTLEIAPNVRVRVERPQITALATPGAADDAKEREKDKTK